MSTLLKASVSTGRCWHMPAVCFSGPSLHRMPSCCSPECHQMYQFTCVASYIENYFFFLNALNYGHEWLQLSQVKIVYINFLRVTFKCPNYTQGIPKKTPKIAPGFFFPSVSTSDWPKFLWDDVIIREWLMWFL